MERIKGGEPVKAKSVMEGFRLYPDFDVNNLPCMCDSPKVKIKKRGQENHAIYWADCSSCKRQWQPALTLSVAISYYVFSVATNKDPFEFKVKKKRKPKVKLDPPEEQIPKCEFKTLEEGKRILKNVEIRVQTLLKHKEKLEKDKRKRKK